MLPDVVISVAGAAGQPERQLRPQDDERQHHEHDQVERNRAGHDLAQSAVPDALDDEQIDADRRRDLAQLDEQDQDHAVHDRIDAVARQHREDQRHRDDDHADALDQAAEHGVEHEQGHEEFESAEFEADDELRHGLADAGEADRVGEDIGDEDDEEDVARELDRVVHGLDESGEAKVAPQRAQDDGQDAADRRALGGRDQPGIDAAQGAGDQQGERQHVAECADELAERAQARLAWRDVGRQGGVDADIGHEQHGHDQPGNPPPP